MSRKIHITEYLKNKAAHSNCTYANGVVSYQGKQYSWQEFDAAFPIKNVELIISINNKISTNINIDKTKVA